MILAFLAAVAAVATPPDAAAKCPADSSGPTLICRALAAQEEGRPDTAAERFEAAAAAFAASDPRRDRALAAAGNMWIAANQPGKAAHVLDKALAGVSTGLQAEQRGLAVLDRARAAEALGDLKTARAKTKEAEATIAADPFLWYFSAALAIREGDAATAKTAIGRALTMAPQDPVILFEAGHVYHFAGDQQAARRYWLEAHRHAGEGPIEKAAREALELLPAFPADGDAGPPQKPKGN